MHASQLLYDIKLCVVCVCVCVLVCLRVCANEGWQDKECLVSWRGFGGCFSLLGPVLGARDGKCVYVCACTLEQRNAAVC